MTTYKSKGLPSKPFTEEELMTKLRTRGYPKDVIIDALFNLAKEFKSNYYWKDDVKHDALIIKLKQVERMIEERRQPSK